MYQQNLCVHKGVHVHMCVHIQIVHTCVHVNIYVHVPTVADVKLLAQCEQILMIGSVVFYDAIHIK